MIVHDELDLPLGIVRVKAGGGLAGHNGLRSIKAHLHSDAFTRVRIGIGKPPGGKEQGADHVLTAPSRRDRTELRGQHRGRRRRRRVHPGRGHSSRPEPVQWLKCPRRLTNSPHRVATTLAPLLPLLRNDDTFTGLRGLRAGVVAVPEPARAFAVAGVAEASGRRPDPGGGADQHRSRTAGP